MSKDHQRNFGGYHNTEQLRVEDIEFYIKEMQKDMEALSILVKRLPKVDDQGNSECPFAESLYAEKEEETKKFIKYLSKLPGYITVVNLEIKRFQQNLRTLRKDTLRLNLSQVAEKYRTAKESYEFHYRKNLQRKVDLVELSGQADKVLKEAQAKKWPLGTPRENVTFRPLPHMEGTTGLSVSEHTPRYLTSPNAGNSTYNEIDSLMAIGPLGK